MTASPASDVRVKSGAALPSSTAKVASRFVESHGRSRCERSRAMDVGVGPATFARIRRGASGTDVDRDPVAALAEPSDSGARSAARARPGAAR